MPVWGAVGRCRCTRSAMLAPCCRIPRRRPSRPSARAGRHVGRGSSRSRGSHSSSIPSHLSPSTCLSACSGSAAGCFRRTDHDSSRSHRRPSPGTCPPVYSDSAVVVRVRPFQRRILHPCRRPRRCSPAAALGSERARPARCVRRALATAGSQCHPARLAGRAVLRVARAQSTPPSSSADGPCHTAGCPS